MSSPGHKRWYDAGLERAAKAAEAEIEPDMADIPEGFEKLCPAKVALSATQATKRNIALAIRALKMGDIR